MEFSKLISIIQENQFDLDNPILRYNYNIIIMFIYRIRKGSYKHYSYMVKITMCESHLDMKKKVLILIMNE